MRPSTPIGTSDSSTPSASECLKHYCRRSRTCNECEDRAYHVAVILASLATVISVLILIITLETRVR